MGRLMLTALVSHLECPRARTVRPNNILQIRLLTFFRSFNKTSWSSPTLQMCSQPQRLKEEGAHLVTRSISIKSSATVQFQLETTQSQGCTPTSGPVRMVGFLRLAIREPNRNSKNKLILKFLSTKREEDYHPKYHLPAKMTTDKSWTSLKSKLMS